MNVKLRSLCLLNQEMRAITHQMKINNKRFFIAWPNNYKWTCYMGLYEMTWDLVNVVCASFFTTYGLLRKPPLKSEAPTCVCTWCHVVSAYLWMKIELFLLEMYVMLVDMWTFLYESCWWINKASVAYYVLKWIKIMWPQMDINVVEYMLLNLQILHVNAVVWCYVSTYCAHISSANAISNWTELVWRVAWAILRWNNVVWALFWVKYVQPFLNWTPIQPKCICVANLT